MRGSSHLKDTHYVNRANAGVVCATFQRFYTSRRATIRSVNSLSLSLSFLLDGANRGSACSSFPRERRTRGAFHRPMCLGGWRTERPARLALSAGFPERPFHTTKSHNSSPRCSTIADKLDDRTRLSLSFYLSSSANAAVRNKF